MALGDVVFVDSSVVAIQAYAEDTEDLVELQTDDRDASALISGTITKNPQSIIRARATMGEAFSPSIPSKAWAADINLELRVDGFQAKDKILPVLKDVVPPSATAGQWLLKVAFMAHEPVNKKATVTNPIYMAVVALDGFTPINPGDSSAEQTFTLSGGAFKYREDYVGTFDDDDTTGALNNSDKWPGAQLAAPTD